MQKVNLYIGKRKGVERELALDRARFKRKLSHAQKQPGQVNF